MTVEHKKGPPEIPPKIRVRKERKKPDSQGEKLRKEAKERLIRLQEALEKAEFPQEPLGLREATEFLREIGPDGYPSVATVEKFVKIAVILGDFSLPPEAVRVTTGGRWHYKLTKRSFLTVFDVLLEILERRNLSLNQAFRKAQETFRRERKDRVPIEVLAASISQRLGITTKRGKEKIKGILVEALQKRKLPLNFDVKPQEILILGVAPEEKDDYVVSWSEFIQKRAEKSVPVHTWPSLTGFLKKQLGLERINLWRLADGAAWLKDQGISVEVIERQIENRLVRYYRLSPQTQEDLKKLLANPKKRAELTRIIT